MLTKVLPRGLKALTLLGALLLCSPALADPPVHTPETVLAPLDDGASQGEDVGAAVAIDGDLAVVGVPGDEAGRGCVLVYAWDSERWRLQQTLKPPASETVTPGRFGAALVLAHGRLTVGAPLSTTPAGEKSGAVYAFDVTSNWALTEIVTSPSARPTDHFGHTVAVTDDTLVVAGNNVAYAFSRVANQWKPDAVLLPPEQFADWPAIVTRPPATGRDDLYDYANDVAVSGTTALVGAPGHQSVYVFVKVGGVWRLQTRLASPHPEPGHQSPISFPPPGAQSLVVVQPQTVYDAFGGSVSLLGNVALVGAQGGNDVNLQGSAYVYERTSTGWVKRSEIRPDVSHSSFGRRVVLAADRAIIGSYHVSRPNSSPAGSSRGAVYIYDVAGTNLTRNSIIDAPFDRAGVFGDGIALSGARVLAGDVGLPAPYLSVTLENGSPFPIVDGGAAYVYAFDGAAWIKQDTLLPGSSGRAEGNRFGTVLATRGNTLVVGMPGDRNSSSTATTAEAGSVVVFHQSSGQWTQQARLTGPSGLPNFGSCVAVDGPVLAAGSPFQPPRIFEQNPQGTWVPVCDVQESGYAVAVSGNRVFVGNRLGTLTEGVSSGRVVVYAKVDGVWCEEATLYAEDAENGASFGHALAVEGSTLVIGAPNDSVYGAVYVFQRGEGGWQQVAKVTAGAHVSASSRFGSAVALDNGTLVVGAPFGGGGNSGEAFVFRQGAGPDVWTLASRLVAPVAVQNAQFGSSVAVDGIGVLVGVPNGISPNGLRQGLAYFFRPSGDQWAASARLAETAVGQLVPGDVDLHRVGESVAMNGQVAMVGVPQGPTPTGSHTGTVGLYTVLGAPQLGFTHDDDGPLNPGEALDFGQALVGTPSTRVLTVTNLSGVPITGLRAVLEGTHGSEVTLVIGLGSPTLEADSSVDLTISFTPGAAGLRTASLRTASLRLSSPDLDADAAVSLRVTGTDTADAPVIDFPPLPQVALVGDAVEFRVQASGSEALTYRWRKNGRLITGAGAPFLRLDAVRAADAGLYSVEVSNDHGKATSTPVRLSVFAPKSPVTVYAKAGVPVSLKVTPLTGQGPLTLQWLVDGQPLISIPNAPPLGWTLPLAQRFIGSVVTLHVSNGAKSSRPVAEFHVQLAETPTLLPVSLGFWTVAGQVQGRLLATLPATKFTATGLPPGVTLTATTGAFAGQPTVPGSYTVRCRAWNAAGAGPERVVPVTVLPLAASTQGSFAGLIDKTAGRFAAQVSTAGLVTTQVTFQFETFRRTGFLTKGYAGNYLFSASLYETTNPHAISYVRETLYLTFQPGSRSVTGEVEVYDQPNGVIYVGPYFPNFTTHYPLTGYRNPWVNSGLTTPQSGRYTARLSGGTPTPVNRAVPLGDGYASLTLSPTGGITWNGRLADGTVVNGTSVLLEGGRIPLCLPLPQSGMVQGWLQVSQVEPFPTSLLQGSVDWTTGSLYRPRLYPLGFYVANMDVSGGQYLPPAAGAPIPGFATTTPNATITFSDGGLGGRGVTGLKTDLTLPPGGVPVLPAVGTTLPANSVALISLRVAPSTGLFTGRLRVNLQSNILADTATQVRTDVEFHGILVQRLGSGTGYFLLPQDMTSTAPLLSGKVTIDPYTAVVTEVR